MIGEKTEMRRKRVLSARCSKCRGMRRWRPLSSSRSRNVISSPQATRVAFVSPFRIPWGDTGTGIKLQWKSTHSALHRRRPLLFSASHCQRREKRVNKILLCTPSSSLASALPFYRRLLSRFLRYRLISRAWRPFLTGARTNRVAHSEPIDGYIRCVQTTFVL